jgi:hypothetical protein
MFVRLKWSWENKFDVNINRNNKEGLRRNKILRLLHRGKYRDIKRKNRLLSLI